MLVGAAPAFALGSGHRQPEVRPFPFRARLGRANGRRGGGDDHSPSPRAAFSQSPGPANVSPILGMHGVRPSWPASAPRPLPSPLTTRHKVTGGRRAGPRPLSGSGSWLGSPALPVTSPRRARGRPRPASAPRAARVPGGRTWRANCGCCCCGDAACGRRPWRPPREVRVDEWAGGLALLPRSWARFLRGRHGGCVRFMRGERGASWCRRTARVSSPTRPQVAGWSPCPRGLLQGLLPVEPSRSFGGGEVEDSSLLQPSAVSGSGNELHLGDPVAPSWRCYCSAPPGCVIWGRCRSRLVSTVVCTWEQH